MGLAWTVNFTNVGGSSREKVTATSGGPGLVGRSTQGPLDEESIRVTSPSWQATATLPMTSPAWSTGHSPSAVTGGRVVVVVEVLVVVVVVVVGLVLVVVVGLVVDVVARVVVVVGRVVVVVARVVVVVGRVVVVAGALVVVGRVVVVVARVVVVVGRVVVVVDGSVVLVDVSTAPTDPVDTTAVVSVSPPVVDAIAVASSTEICCRSSSSVTVWSTREPARRSWIWTRTLASVSSARMSSRR